MASRMVVKVTRSRIGGRSRRWPGVDAGSSARMRRRRDPVLMASVGVIALMVLCAILAPVLAPHDPWAVDPLAPYAGMSAGHPLGTDSLGRDLLSRLLYAARPSLVGPAIVVSASAVLGTAIGIALAWVGGTVDAAVTRVVDIIYAFPSLILAILVVAMVGTGLVGPVVTLCITSTPYMLRVIRTAARRERRLPYIEALWLQGVPTRTICGRHILRAVLPLVIIQASLFFGYAMSDLAAISFLGLGLQPPSSDWGLLVAEGQGALLDGYPQQALFAGGIIVIVVVALNVIADRLAARWSLKVI